MDLHRKGRFGAVFYIVGLGAQKNWIDFFVIRYGPILVIKNVLIPIIIYYDTWVLMVLLVQEILGTITMGKDIR